MSLFIASIATAVIAGALSGVVASTGLIEDLLSNLPTVQGTTYGYFPGLTGATLVQSGISAGGPTLTISIVGSSAIYELTGNLVKVSQNLAITYTNGSTTGPTGFTGFQASGAGFTLPTFLQSGNSLAMFMYSSVNFDFSQTPVSMEISEVSTGAFVNLTFIFNNPNGIAWGLPIVFNASYSLTYIIQ